MPNVADDLKAGSNGLSVSEALQLPVSTLLGVNDGAADALRRIGIDTIFDLGSSWLFANASAAARPGVGGPSISSTLFLDSLPAEPPDDAGSLALESLRGLPDEDAAAIKQGLAIQTVRDFALWPPHRVAQRMMSEANGGGAVDAEEEHVEALRPRMGEYPTERVYYKSLVMLGMAADAERQPLTGAISLQPAVDDPAGFGHPAVGAVVTLSQSWYAKGITLGHMLHSLALAPGEATRIAVVDWSKRSRATVSETIEEAEQVDSSSQHSRAISEVQNAVASEMQSGGSMSSGWSKSTSTGKSGGFSLGGGVAGAFTGGTYAAGHGGGIGTSQQDAKTETEANSTAWSIGNRSVMAEMAQRVNDRTEQHSTSVRNRRASAVREVSQSEHEQVSTRVVANYNHMHALTVQYYEVVQIYRVMVQVHEVQRVLFVPFELLDFGNVGAAEVVARFRSQLLAAALTVRVAGLLLDDRGEVEIRGAVRMLVPSRVGDVFRSDLVAIARMARGGAATDAAPGSTVELPATDAAIFTAPAPAAVRRITSPGAVVDALPGDAELVAVSFEGVHVDRARFDQAGVPAENSTYAVSAATFQIDFPAGLVLRNVTAVHVTKSEDDADSGTMTLHYRADGRQLTLPVPLDLAAGTSMQKVAFLAADRSNRREELMAHLQANRAYYSQAVLRNLDTPTLVMLLSRFSWKGKPLADQVEPKPLAVAGNYLVLRAPVEDDDAAGIDDTGTTWRDLLSRRGLTTEQRDDRLVPIPTGGVFAEAVLGRANSAEKLDITRFWNWQDSPIPLQPTEIAPISTGSRATGEDLRPGQLGAPVLNILNPTSLPEPAGLSAALNTLAAANMFRDMSGLAGTQRLADAMSAGTLDAAGEAGRLASANLKTATDQAVAMGQAAADMWKVQQTSKAGAGGGGGASGSGTSISADGARINHGRDMDERGLTDSTGAPSRPRGGQMATHLASEFASEFGADGGGTGGSAPTSREVAYADEGVAASPHLVHAVATGLGGGHSASASSAAAGVPYPLSIQADRPQHLDWPTNDFPAPNDIANRFRVIYNERIDKGVFVGPTAAFGLPGTMLGVTAAEENDVRGTALSWIANSWTQRVATDSGREELRHGIFCVALASAIEAAGAMRATLALPASGVTISTSLTTPYGVWYSARRVGMVMAWLDRGIRKSTATESERIARAKKAWEAEAGAVIDALTSWVPPGADTIITSGLGSLLGQLSPRFDEQFASYQAIMNTFQAAYKRLAREFFAAALRVNLPAHNQLDPAVQAASHEFEAHVLGGWNAEAAFLAA